MNDIAKNITTVIMGFIQAIMGIFILFNKADIRTLAWFYVIQGVATLVLLSLAGLIYSNIKEK